MLRNRIYYGAKPFIPQRLRMAVRRQLAMRRRPKVAEIWPIMPGSERPPEGWPGWPDGKKFAVVLTHDVEGQRGLDKCRALMELEMEMGFHSSFNFIPQGNYRVPAALRDELTRNGFEVGIHDLKHDGKLFRSAAEFRARATIINEYLRDWNAVGFRAGFMLHNLDWIHNLDIEYDMSTFDTDPFEPQPDGHHTIFPFWVPAPSAQSSEDRGRKTEDGRPKTDDSGHQSSDFSLSARQPQPSNFSVGKPGLASGCVTAGSQPSNFSLSESQSFSLSKTGYVELPYTLPQDSTLFLILRERSIDIWLRKLDWIAEHGGMVLVNVHPDYVRFAGEPTSKRTFDAQLYRQLLEYIRERYRSEFWQPLPAEMARFVRKLERPPTSRPRKRICMVTYSSYQSDNRVMRYAKALAARGDHVDVVSLRRMPEAPRVETAEGVNIVRIQDRFGKSERSKMGFLWPLLRFLTKASVWVTRSHARQPYDLLHIHNMPDFMVFAGWYPKLTGKPIILDIHDVVPEFFTSKFRTPPKGAFFAILRQMERWSARFANHIIIANHLWLEKYTLRTGSEGRVTPFINHVDSNLFLPDPDRQKNAKSIILFPGGLQWHQGVDIAIEAFAKVRAQFPNVEFHIYGDGDAKEDLVALAKRLQLNGSVRFFETLPASQIAAVMAQADLGVVPKRADSFGDEAYSTKVMEFMSVGVPVIVSSTQVDHYYFDDSVVRFFESGNSEALAEQMLNILRDPDSSQTMVANAELYAARNCWSQRSADYLDLVDNLCGHGRS